MNITMYGWANLTICFQAILVSGVGNSFRVFPPLFLLKFLTIKNFNKKFNYNYLIKTKFLGYT